jgi:hypothetical protein
MTISTVLCLHRELLGEGEGQTMPGISGEGRDAPPPEVSAAVLEALEVVGRLEDAGRALRIRIDPHTGRVCAHILDGEGQLIQTVGPRQILDLAAGEPLV